MESLKNKKRNSTEFDSIKKYYINLDRSKERNNFILNEFRSYNIKNFQRVSGCDGKTLKDKYKGQFEGLKFVNNKDKKITKYALATTCSHLKTIKKAYDNKDEIAIIMEDDITFRLLPYWEKEIKDITENLPEDLEILLLAHGICDNWKKINTIKSLFYFTKPDFKDQFYNQKMKKRSKHETFMAGCYIVTRRGMKKIVDTFFKGNEIHNDLEDFVIDIGVFDIMNTYYLTRPLFPLDGFHHKSTIGHPVNDYYLSYKILDYYNKIN